MGRNVDNRYIDTHPPLGAIVTHYLDSEAEQSRYFDDWAPPGLDRALLRLVLDAYSRAKEICESITSREEDRDLRGHVRRAVLDSSLPTLMGRYAVIVQPTPNATNTQIHREVRFHDIVLTASHLRHRREDLRVSQFRDTLARWQTPMFPDEESALPEDQRLLAVLAHGSPSPFDDVPDFVSIVFPIVGGSHGLGIDLLERFRALAPRPEARPEFGKPKPKLRTDVALPNDAEEERKSESESDNE